jgi:hypothetical protein
MKASNKPLSFPLHDSPVRGGATNRSERFSLVLSTFVASFICLLVYMTSFTKVHVAESVLNLRGNEMEGASPPPKLDSSRDPQAVWIMSFGGSV